MSQQSYFYQFLAPISKELAGLARELEYSIFTSPRTMLTHARVFVENILIQVMQAEDITADTWITLKERLDLLSVKGYLTEEVRDALHQVRRVGNQAAHDSRMFRYSEALLSWESIYIVVKWYVEVYGPVELLVPNYKDPTPQTEQVYDSTELESRLERLENLLKQTLQPKETDPSKEKNLAMPVEAPTELERPGFTTIRIITYNDKRLEIPYFLRDAFLLPQRFDASERFLIRLGGEQQARIMSELPNDLEGLHKFVTRYSDANDANFFKELQVFVEEEKARRQLKLDCPGELFFFYKENHIVVTESLASLLIINEEFTGFPNFIRQLNEQGFERVGQLPSELVTLAKYKGVGKGTLEKFFEQLKEKQGLAVG